MHQSSFVKMNQFVEKYLDVNKKLNILDLGAYDVCGTYKALFSKPNWKYTGCDIEAGPNVDLVMPNQYGIPASNNTYDVVVSGQALEHMEFFWQTMKEVDRVTKRGGLICVIAPGSGPIHRHPIDCWRFHPDGMDTIIKWIDFIKLETYIDIDSDWQDCVLIAQKK
jgi:SAM-dependent methyltransferase